MLLLRVNRFAAASAERWLLLEVLAHLAFARAVVLGAPARWLPVLLGVARRPGDPGAANPGPDSMAAAKVGGAVRVVGRRTPWSSTCLVRAMAGHWMLRRRGIPTSLHLGTRRGPAGLKAHAWLTSGGRVLIGGHVRHLRYASLARFDGPDQA